MKITISNTSGIHVKRCYDVLQTNGQRNRPEGSTEFTTCINPETETYRQEGCISNCVHSVKPEKYTGNLIINLYFRRDSGDPIEKIQGYYMSSYGYGPAMVSNNVRLYKRY